jgi:transposase-like protein
MNHDNSSVREGRGQSVKSLREDAYQDFLGGMSIKDIAEKHGVPVNTVNSWKHRYWEPDPDAAPKKKSGGQKGNQNARKHGKYSKLLRSASPEDLRHLISKRNSDEEAPFLAEVNFCRMKIVEYCHLASAAMKRFEEAGGAAGEDAESMMKEMARIDDAIEKYHSIETRAFGQVLAIRKLAIVQAASGAGMNGEVYRPFKDMPQDEMFSLARELGAASALSQKAAT